MKNYLIFLIAFVFMAFVPDSLRREKPLKIIFLGDFGFENAQIESNTDQVFFDLITHFLDDNHIKSEIISYFFNSATSVSILEKIPQVIAEQPDIVVFMTGSNDAFIERGNHESNIPIELFKQQTRNIISQLRDKKIEVILMTPLPLGNFPNGEYEPYISNGKNNFIKPYVAACREIAQNHQILIADNFNYWGGKEKHGQNIDSWLYDGIHPNKQGLEKIANTLFPALIIDSRKPTQLKRMIHDGEIILAHSVGELPKPKNGFLEISGNLNDLYGNYMPSVGDFELILEFRIDQFNNSIPEIVFGDTEIIFDSISQSLLLKGRISGYNNSKIEIQDFFNEMNSWNTMSITRIDNKISLCLNKDTITNIYYRDGFEGKAGIKPGKSIMQIKSFSVWGNLIEVAQKPKSYSIPIIDLAYDTVNQVIIDKEKGQYLGHPSTVLLEDNKTIYAAYPKGHGIGAIVMKKSEDAGITWSNRLPIPENWAGSLEVPTLYRTEDIAGKRRILMFSGRYPIRMAVSEDDGSTWSSLKPVFDFGGIVAMSDILRMKNGNYMAFFHDNGKYYNIHGKNINKFNVYKTLSEDGGLHWTDPELVVHHKSAMLCEPGIIRSPDGNQIAMLLRENSRIYNSMVIFSNDEGKTWSEPVELPASLTGDRHQLRYTPDGRIIALFRDMAELTPTKGDFVAWVGTYEDILLQNEGQYRVRLLDNVDFFDCGYPGLELLNDGVFIAITYGHWEKGEKPYIKSLRFKMEEIDSLANNRVFLD